MGREVWGTYSVTDHLAEAAFLADLVLYDRLVLPVPEESADPAATAAWQRWNRPRQEAFLRRLEPKGRAITVPWRVGRWAEEREAFAEELAARPGIDAEVAKAAARDSFLFTRASLVTDLPMKGVRGVTTVPTAFAEGPIAGRLGFALDKTGQLAASTKGPVAAVMGLRFLVPDLGRRVEPDDLDLILEHTGSSAQTKARRAFWSWQRDFFGDDVIAEQETLTAAAEEMADLLSDLNQAAHWGKVKTRTAFGFLVGGIVLGMMGGPLTAVGLGGVALSVARYAVDRQIDARLPRRAPEAAVFSLSGTDLPFRKA
jgi:hypothetical protein